MNKKPSTDNSSEKIHIDMKIAIAIIVTLALFFVSVIGMFVSMAIDNADSGSGYIAGGDGGGGGGGKNTQAVAADKTEKTKTDISLPSATGTGNFRYNSDAATVDISADTDIKSAAAILVDITDGRAVAQKNADTKIYPASMTKVMTLLVACENAKDPTTLLTVTKEMVEKYAKPENKGASIAFEWQEGNQITVEDALYLIIYKSDTYACWLLAEHIAGSEEAFVKMMNDKAKSLGLTGTNFTNCTGLYNTNHYTTCREMAAIMAAVMNNPTATAVITKYSEYTVDLYLNGEKTEESMFCDWYTARLEKYRWGAAAAYYAGNGSDIKIVGGKTGWETIPTSCFVTTAIDDISGRKYICVQVGRTDSAQESINSKTSTDDTRLIYQKYAKEKE